MTKNWTESTPSEPAAVCSSSGRGFAPPSTRTNRPHKDRHLSKLLQLAIAIRRNFKAEKPNQKWVTDISYIKTGQGTLYLSVIRDLFDNSIVAYKTGTEQNINLVLSTIREAKKKEKISDYLSRVDA